MRQPRREFSFPVLLAAATVVAILLPGFAAAQAGPYQYYALTPCRVVDTREPSEPLRQGGLVTASVQRNLTIQGRCGVPTGAAAITLNLTITSPTQNGFVSLWPVGGAFPVVSTINFLAGEPALANGAIVPLAAATPDLAAIYGTATGAGTIHIIVDVTGYFD
jgi:hypothetical protein